MKPSVLVVLDMREYRDPPATPDGYRELWRELEADLVHRDLRRTPSVRWDRPGRGTVGVQIVNQDSCPAAVDADTTFAVCGIVEPPRLLYRCGTCSDAGRASYGPFRCGGCPDDPARRVCDDHVVVLDLNFARVTCPQHVPSCGCARTATFWCAGRQCDRRKAWCDLHRRQHPGDPLTSYCPDCYDQRFPACVASGCASTGSLACEHQQDGRACRTRVCPGHGYRWQIYGPNTRGLVLCPEHHPTRLRLTREEIVYQTLAATAARSRSHNPRLPTLGTVRHLFINLRRELVPIPEVHRLMTDVAGRPGVRSRALDDLVAERRAAWQREVKDNGDKQQEGQRRIEALQRQLIAEGKAEVAQAIALSDFKPHSNQLWVKVPDALKGRFIGPGGSTIKKMENVLGVRIRLEEL